MTLEQAREAIKKDYPDGEIGLGFEYEGAWYFRVSGGDYASIHAVDEKSGIVTGALPLMALLEDEKFSKALKEAGKREKKDSGLSGGEFLEQSAMPTEERSWRGEDFLAHHGILGQKWGVRRFQDKDGRLTAEGKARYSKKKPTGEDTKEGLAAEAVLAVAELSVMTAVTATAITRAAISKHNEKMGDKLLDKKKIADTSIKFSDKNPPKRIQGEHTAEDDMAKVNEAYGGLRPQTQNNCSHCSITMELRRRGYDVCARTSSEPVYTDLQLEKCFKPKPKNDVLGWDRPKNWEKMKQEEKNEAWRRAKFEKKVANNFSDVAKTMLKKYPEGSRGLFSAINPFVFVGHAMAFEVKGGKVMIYDTQTNKKFNLASPPAIFTQNFSAVSSNAWRLDDKKINWEGMNDICAQRIKKG